MKVTILGTGTFYVSTEHSGPAYLLEVDGKKILIDCGPGTLMRLSQIGVKPDELDYIFISHFHADHTGDLFALQMNLRLKDFFSDEKDYKTPIIIGPEGIITFTKRLSEVYQLPAFDNYTKIEYRTFENLHQIGGLVVKPIRVEHNAFGVSAEAFALRFEHEGKTFTFSGDSVKHSGLIEACKDANIFICDASYSKGKGSVAHLDTYEIGEVATKSNVKKLILTHFYPNTVPNDLVEEVKEKFDGEVVAGLDLMEVEI